jgi:DNA (cytosine-5)-methyltransferase 1
VSLHDFEIFRPPGSAHGEYELSSLHLLPRRKELCFSGIASLGTEKYHLQDITFSDHSIEGYGDAENSGIVTYIQPKLALVDTEFDIWFRLYEPAPRYLRFHGPFQWIAKFSRHVLDYMEHQPPDSVGLEDFQANFFLWLNARFGHDTDFKAWHAMFGGKSDFRVTFHAHVGYIFQQADGLENPSLLAHPVWSQCMQGSDYIKKEAVTMTKTIATPHVYGCFSHMYFGEKLKSVQPCESVRREQAKRKRTLGFASDSTGPVPQKQPGSHHPSHELSVRAGDVIAFKPEEKDTIYWKKKETEWLAYVQRVEPLSDGTDRLFVIWIYRPDETNMFLASYPIKKEVFLSDNCNCDEGVLLSSDVSRKLTVHWLPYTLDTSRDVLIRQTYITSESSFVTLQNDHLTCTCNQENYTSVNSYHRGDTVYITKTLQDKKILEPALVHYVDKESQAITVRLFLRLGRDCKEMLGYPQRGHTAPNELVLTDRLSKVRSSCIERPCHIRFLANHEILSKVIPVPYDRGGAGDFWFLGMGLEEEDGCCKLIDLVRLPNPFKESVNCVDGKPEKLRGLSIFSGGGNLDRGLEEGGAVEFTTAVDYSPEAMHTQRANARNPDSMKFFCGSVDDHLAAMFSGTIPPLNENLVSGGTPWLVNLCANKCLLT